jgi:hypothetical protein
MSSDFTFDLSKISYRSFKPMVQGLEAVGFDCIATLTFTTNYSVDTPPDLFDESLVVQSIMRRFPDYFTKIVRTLSQLVPASHILSSLRFCRMAADIKSMDALGSIFTGPHCIRVIVFEKMEIGDPAWISFFNALKDAEAPDLVFRDCDISDDIIDPVANHIRSRRRRHGTVGRLNLVQNHVSQYVLRHIERLRDGKSVEEAESSSDHEEEANKREPLGNRPTHEDISAESTDALPHEDEEQSGGAKSTEPGAATEARTDSEAGQQGRMPQRHAGKVTPGAGLGTGGSRDDDHEPIGNEASTRLKTGSAASVHRDPGEPETSVQAGMEFQDVFEKDPRLCGLGSANEEERLFAENQRLRVQIERLKAIAQHADERGSLFIVGDGCSTVLDVMERVDQRLEQLMETC